MNPQNIFLLQKNSFFIKSANKSTEILQIKIYLLLYSPFQGYALSWISDACPNDLSQSKNYYLSQSKNEKSTFLHFYIFTEKYLFE